MKKSISLIFAALFLTACAGNQTPNENLENDVSQKTFSEAVNNLPDAKNSEIAELKDGDNYDLKAEIVKKNFGKNVVKMLGYNGQIPGPVIKVKQGAEVVLNLFNNTDVETSLHSHGIRLENLFDGTDLVQKAVQIGEKFSYTIKFPDPGVYFYHPHFREDYAQELGLYGNYVVEPKDPNYWNKVNREEYVFLDDIFIDDDGILPFYPDFIDHALMGRFGNTMFVNGSTNYNLEVKAGEVVRFAFTNSANTRPFKVVVPGVKMKLVGGDGGRYEKDEIVDSFVLGSSERAIVEMYFEKAGEYKLINRTPEKDYELGSFVVSSEKIAENFGQDFAKLRVNTDVRDAVPNLEEYFDKAPDKKLRLTIEIMDGMMGGGGESGMMGGHMMQVADEQASVGSGNGHKMGAMMHDSDEDEGIEWEDDMQMMNMFSTNKTLEWKIVDDEAGQENMNIDWKFKKGEFVKVRIFNDPESMHPMQHPVHFHGQRFLVLNKDGVRNENFVWKDSVLVPKGSTFDILVEISNPGMWMVHCHTAEHLHSNMMFGFGVEEEGL